MSSKSNEQLRRDLLEVSWTFALSAKFAFDTGTGYLIDANPAAELMTGLRRDELLGMHQSLLYPESEREMAREVFSTAVHQATLRGGLHVQHKDGHCIPVMFSSSQPKELDGIQLLIAEFLDISEVWHREHLLSAQNWALTAYSRAAIAIAHLKSPDDLMKSICEAITSESAYVLALVCFADDSPGKPIRIAGAAGTATGYLDSLVASWSDDAPSGQGPTGTCLRKNELQLMEDAETSLGFEVWRERARRNGIRSILAVPFAAEQGSRGALVVFAAEPKAFEGKAIEVFERLASQVGYGLRSLHQEQLLNAERSRLDEAQKQLTAALTATVAAMSVTMEMRDPYTAGHQSRVAQISHAIGEELGWDESRLTGVRLAAQIHDIGKISIPIEILTKPVQLTTTERAMIKTHPETAYAILKDIPFAWPIADIVRQHHEKLDGSGYPMGLMADEILPEAKVLAVADIVEAMSSLRPYRPALGLEAALAEVEKEAGTTLDPKAVQACLRLFREKHFLLPE